MVNEGTLNGGLAATRRTERAPLLQGLKEAGDAVAQQAAQKLAVSLEKILPYLLNYFSHRISNAMTEGFNSVIQQIKSAARGFRSFQSHRTMILFFCGKLDLSLA
jgi:transposase